MCWCWISGLTGWGLLSLCPGGSVHSGGARRRPSGLFGCPWSFCCCWHSNRLVSTRLECPWARDALRVRVGNRAAVLETTSDLSVWKFRKTDVLMITVLFTSFFLLFVVRENLFILICHQRISSKTENELIFCLVPLICRSCELIINWRIYYKKLKIKRHFYFLLLQTWKCYENVLR